MKLKSPIFIVGMPRSGTTLVSNLLNATREVYIPEETHYFRLEEAFMLNSKGKKNFKDYFLDPATNKNLIGLQLSDRMKKDVLSSDESDLLATICRLKSEEKGILQWGEKTPLHFLFLERILSQYPNAKIINVYRDPRDVLPSIKKAKWNKVFNLKGWLELYKFNIRLLEENYDNCIHIAYEKLVSSPDEVLKELCSFLGISFDEKIIDEFYLPKNLNFSTEAEPWKMQNQGPISSTNVFKWKKNGGSEKIMNKFISWFLKDELIKLGYDVLPSPNLLIRNALLIYYSIIEAFVWSYKRLLRMN